MLKDYFIFTKGERTALSILIVLILISTGFLFGSKSNNTIAVNAEKEDSTFFKSYIYEKERSQEIEDSSISGKQNIHKQINKKTYAPQKKNYYIKKLKPGTIVELNAADTTLLKRVPGIGTVFANRIIKFRKLLRGFYSVEQLREVYGIDNDRFKTLKPWFSVDSSLIQKIRVNYILKDKLKYHPYLNYKQKNAIQYLLQNQEKINNWEELLMMDEFTENKDYRLKPYLSFE